MYLPKHQVSASNSTNKASTNDSSAEYWDDVDIEACLWQREHEHILSRISDQALCYHWLTNKSMKVYKFYDMLFTIPVILISTISGTANFAQMQISEEYRNSALMITGAFNIFGGVLHTLHQYVKISEKVEKFRHNSEEWLKLHHFLKFELSRRPTERISPGKLLREASTNFEKFVSRCPEIPDRIIEEFKDTYQGCSTFNIITKPEICNFLAGTEQYIFTQEKGYVSGKVDCIASQQQISSDINNNIVKVEQDEKPVIQKTEIELVFENGSYSSIQEICPE